MAWRFVNDRRACQWGRFSKSQACADYSMCLHPLPGRSALLLQLKGINRNWHGDLQAEDNTTSMKEIAVPSFVHPPLRVLS